MAEDTTNQSQAEKTPHWINRPYWEFWGVVITLVLFAAGYWISQRQEKFSDLSYTVLSSEPLVDVKDTVGGRLRLMFDGKVVKDLNISLIKIYNAGTEPLKAVDFEGPLTVSLGRGVRIYTAQITQREPISVQANLSFPSKVSKEAKLLVKTGLLNPNDSIVVQVISSGSPKIFLSGRVVGVSQITRHETSAKAGKDTNLSQWGMLVWTLAALLWAVLFSISERQLKKARIENEEIYQKHRKVTEHSYEFLKALLDIQGDKKRTIHRHLFDFQLGIVPYLVVDDKGLQKLAQFEQIMELHEEEENKFYQLIRNEAWPPSP